MATMDGQIAVLCSTRGPWEFQRYPLPDPEPGAILVRISYANVCGSDLHRWRGEMATQDYGDAMGKEREGPVVALGKGGETDSTGKPLGEGDRIIYNYFVPCGRCVACLRGTSECCPNKRRPGNGVPGQFPYFLAGFSEYYYLLPGHVCVKVPDELSDAVVAPVNCALAQVLQALDSGGFRQGDSLVVQGAGGLGLNMIAAARDMGASLIVAVDGIPGRLALAREFGADYTVDIRDCPTPADRVAAVREFTNGQGVTHAADVAGVKGVIAEGIEMLSNGGTPLEGDSLIDRPPISLHPNPPYPPPLLTAPLSQYHH